MASCIFTSCLRDAFIGGIDFDTDTFYMMLTTASYVPQKSVHTKRSDITNEVTGTGYTAGGKVCPITVSAINATTHSFTINVPQVEWPSSTIAGAKVAVVYKRRGGAASADELVLAIDFTSAITSSGNSLIVFASTLTMVNVS